MNAGEILGGVALVGIVALVALAVTADDEPQTLTSATTTATTLHGGPSTTTTEGDSTTTASTDPTTSDTVEPATTGAERPTSPPSTESRATTEPETTDAPTTEPPPPPSAEPTATTEAPTTTVAEPLSAAERADVVVRVLNGGADAGAAAFVSGVLETAGFEPIEALDAAEPVEATSVFYAQGMERQAADVNALIEADPSRVVRGTEADSNWRQFGPFVDVLVVVGPS